MATVDLRFTYFMRVGLSFTNASHDLDLLLDVPF